MKKNITINLFGTLYNIDEDAYQLLDSYLKSMKRYFGDKDGGSEIANDIEHRVAELLWEKKQHGMEAVNIDIIKEIISTIGDAEAIAGDDKAEGTTGQSSASFATNENHGTAHSSTLWHRMKAHFQHRRLYRDARNGLLAGVCSGLSYYFGFGDPVFWRLAAILLLIFGSGLSFWIYLLLWFIVPYARTPEDRLRMKGVQPTPESINQQILSEHGSPCNPDASQNPSSSTTNNYYYDKGNNGSGCLKGMLGCLLMFLLFPFLIVVVVVCIGFTGVAGMLTGLLSGFVGNLWELDFQFLHTSVPHLVWTIFPGIIAALVALVIPLVWGIRRMSGSYRHTSTLTKYVIIIVEVLCILWAVSSISNGVTMLHSISREYRHKLWASPSSFWSQQRRDDLYLEEHGFIVPANNTPRITWAGDYPTGDADRRYLDVREHNDDLIFTAEKRDTVKPGTYDLYALARAQGTGAVIYASCNGQDRHITPIPACGNQGGTLWQWACGKDSIDGMQQAYPHLCPDSVRQQIASAYGLDGLGWSVVSIRGITVGKDSIVSYGVSTQEEISQMSPQCERVSATDFVLVPR